MNSAWLATCALLDRAEVAGVLSSVWDNDDARRGAAESVRASLERFLYPPGGSNARVGSAYDPTSTGQAIAALATTLNVGELSHVVASVLDQVCWPSFTRDWLADRGRVFDLCSGDRYPVGEMRLMGSVGHSARP